MAQLYKCPECGQEIELYAESHEEIELYCPDCELDFTDQYPDIYADYISTQIDRATDYFDR